MLFDKQMGTPSMFIDMGVAQKYKNKAAGIFFVMRNQE